MKMMSRESREIIKAYFGSLVLGYGIFGDKAFKPMKTLHEDEFFELISPTHMEYHGVCFDLAGINKINYNPIVISEINDYVYFLRSKWISTNGVRSLIKSDELLIDKKYAYISSPTIKVCNKSRSFCFCYNAFIDTTRLFVMKSSDFFECYNFNLKIISKKNYLVPKTNYLIDYEKEIILNQLKNNINNGNYALTKVIRTNVDGINKNYSQLIYAKNEWIQIEINDWRKRLALVKGFEKQNEKTLKRMNFYIEQYHNLTSMPSYSKTISNILNPILDKINDFLTIRINMLKILPNELVSFSSNDISRNAMRLYLYQENIGYPILNYFEQTLYPNLNITLDEVKVLMNKDFYMNLSFLKPLKAKLSTNIVTKRKIK